MYQNFQTYRFLLLLVASCLCAFFAWAGISEIDQQVRGSGKIIPSGKVRSIQHLEDGIVREILVKEGQTVQAGDSLFQLINTKAEADMKEINVGLSALLIKQIRLQAELKDQEGFSVPGSLAQNNEGIVKAEKDLFKARRAEFVEKANGLKKRMKQKVLKLDDNEANIANLEKERAISQEQLAIKRKLRDSGAISRSQYLEEESKVKNFNTRISSVRKEIPITKSEISEIVNLLEETRQKRRSDIVEELNGVNVDIKKLQERIVTFSDAVNRTSIQAPINGVINKLHVNTIGGVVQSGQVLAEIIPLEETLIVEGKIATKDRGKIWEGLPVAAKITAYESSIYGSMNGTLTYISADSFTDNQGTSYYQVRATLDNSALSEDKPVFSGMSVDLNILASKISVLHAIMRPLTSIRENALREL